MIRKIRKNNPFFIFNKNIEGLAPPFERWTYTYKD